eukprot:CAMPEP_0170462796 /NCGR_PEP_ID=MMETSP0123-20130129/8159_1 /TAXON_ID=182087 /ORGANISM="Favella ehrenbergii, Strain Fehren 1" /LENGTH=60 /DNA_ID=CAMNT_0010728089 /DNA_START=822 /DNA_END=1004 /DNA_ORIENTATION=-
MEGKQNGGAMDNLNSDEELARLMHDGTANQGAAAHDVEMQDESNAAADKENQANGNGAIP